MPMILTAGAEVTVVVDPVERSDCLPIISPIMDLLSVTGGDRYHPTYGGAGGGGRIAMIARKALVPGQYDVSGGRNTEGDIIAGDGTIYVEAGEGGMSVLNAPSGSLVIDGSGGSILYSGPVGSGLAFGQVEDKVVAAGGADTSYSVATFTFDSINIGSATVVQVKGSSSVVLKTRNHGNITIDATISVDGSSDSTAGPGGFKGGAPNTNGEGPGGGTNVLGSGGSYGGAGEGETLPTLYGDARLASLIGGSGGRGLADSGGGGAGAFGLEANGTGDITIGSTGVLSARGGGSAAGAGAGGSIYLKGDVITNNGTIRATGGVSSNSSPMNGGGGRVAIHTVKSATFGTINVGNGSTSVVGDMGARTLQFTEGSLVFDTEGATWYHSGGTHGEGSIFAAYDFNGKEIDAAVFNIEKIDLGAGVNVSVLGTNALVLKDANGTGITIKSNISHNVADSGISIESNGNVNIGRSDGTFNTVASNGNGGTLQIRGQAIVNTGKLHANGSGGRLILAYESDYFEMGGGSKDYTQLIEMTRPQITGSLDLNMSYSITPTAINEDYMTAWFRFEEGSGEKTYSDYGGYTGTFGGNGGNRPGWAAGQFGGAVEFSSNEWINTDAFADTMEVGEAKPRTISIWFKPYLQSHWGSAPITTVGTLVFIGWVQRMLALVLPVMVGDLEALTEGSAGGNNYQRMISQHNGWDPQFVVNEGMMDRWVHIAHIYTGTDLQVYVDGIKRYENAQAMYTSGKSVGITVICDLVCSIPGQMSVVLLRD